MSDRTDSGRDPLARIEHAHALRRALPTLEQARLAYAQARADEHSVRELYFLELAVQAPDENSACALESHAYEAYLDAVAVTKEHRLDD